MLIGKLKTRKNLGDLGVHERMILQWNFGKWIWRWEVYLTENKEQWMINMHTMKKLWVQVRLGAGGLSWVAEQLLASFEGICFVDFFDGVDRREV